MCNEIVKLRAAQDTKIIIIMCFLRNADSSENVLLNFNVFGKTWPKVQEKVRSENCT